MGRRAVPAVAAREIYHDVLAAARRGEAYHAFSTRREVGEAPSCRGRAQSQAGVTTISMSLDRRSVALPGGGPPAGDTLRMPDDSSLQSGPVTFAAGSVHPDR